MMRVYVKEMEWCFERDCVAVYHKVSAADESDYLPRCRIVIDTGQLLTRSGSRAARCQRKMCRLMQLMMGGAESVISEERFRGCRNMMVMTMSVVTMIVGWQEVCCRPFFDS